MKNNKLTIHLFFLLSLLSSTIYADCNHLSGQWRGVWRVFNNKNKVTIWSVNTTIVSDGENVILNYHLKDPNDNLNELHIHGTCYDNELFLNGTNSISLSGVYIDDEITLTGYNNSSYYIDSNLKRIN